MISSCSFRKLQGEDIKRRIWLLLFSVYLYITYIIDYALAQSGQKLLFGDIRLGPSNSTVFWITMLLAVISALQGFSFLFSEEKTDFYFSLPVKRSRLFLSIYINGVLFSVVPCILSRLICYFIEGSRTPTALYEVWMGILVNLIGFLMIYHLIICVVFLTGQLLTATLGTALVFSYGVFTFGYVFQKYSSSFFSTYYKIDLINALAIYVSPYHLYNVLSGKDTIQEIGEWKFSNYMTPFIVMLLITFLLFLAAYFLFKKRPAESTGRTLTFHRSASVIKFMLAIPVIMTVGYFTMSLSLNGRSLSLLVVGILSSALVINGLLESLLQSDIKCFFSRKIHTAMLIALCIIGSASFYFDIWNFDSYLPEAKHVDSAAVYIYGLDEADTILATHALSDFYRADMQLDSMHLTGDDKEALISWISDIRKTTVDTEPPLTYIAVAYHNKTQTTYRKYPVYRYEDLDAFSSIYDSVSYKTSAFPLLADQHVGTRHFVWSNGIETFHLDLTEEENIELLENLSKDSFALSLNDLKAALPIGALSLVYTGSESGEQLYLYPTFENTLSYLESLGLPAKKGIEDYKVIGIQIFEKFSETSAFGKVTNSRKRILDTTNPEEIEELIPTLFPDSYGINPLLYPTAGQYQAVVSVQDTQKRTMQYLTMTLKNGKVTETLPSLHE